MREKEISTQPTPNKTLNQYIGVQKTIMTYSTANAAKVSADQIIAPPVNNIQGVIIASNVAYHTYTDPASLTLMVEAQKRYKATNKFENKGHSAFINDGTRKLFGESLASQLTKATGSLWVTVNDFMSANEIEDQNASNREGDVIRVADELRISLYAESNNNKVKVRLSTRFQIMKGVNDTTGNKGCTTHKRFEDLEGFYTNDAPTASINIGVLTVSTAVKRIQKDLLSTEVTAYQALKTKQHREYVLSEAKGKDTLKNMVESIDPAYVDNLTNRDYDRAEFSTPYRFEIEGTEIKSVDIKNAHNGVADVEISKVTADQLAKIMQVLKGEL